MKEIVSPMVGTFYRAASPDAPHFVEVGKPVTEDTVDFLPGGAALNTDDTVALSPPTWLQRLTDRIDSALTGAISKVVRPSAQTQPRQTRTRKR